MSSSTMNLASMIEVKPQQSISARLYDQISNLILNGDLPPGYTFPNETELCQQFSVGRSTIREAYKALELQGFVTRTKKGTVVNNQTQINSASSLISLINTAHNSDFIDFRFMVEIEAAGLAALRATDEELKEIDRLEEQIRLQLENKQPGNSGELDFELHNNIANASHNRLLISAIAAVSETWHSESRKNWFEVNQVNTEEGYRAVIEGHKDIIKRLHEHNAAGAREAMKKHLEFVVHKKYI